MLTSRVFREAPMAPQEAYPDAIGSDEKLLSWEDTG